MFNLSWAHFLFISFVVVCRGSSNYNRHWHKTGQGVLSFYSRGYRVQAGRTRLKVPKEDYVICVGTPTKDLSSRCRVGTHCIITNWAWDNVSVLAVVLPSAGEIKFCSTQYLRIHQSRCKEKVISVCYCVMCDDGEIFSKIWPPWSHRRSACAY